MTKLYFVLLMLVLFLASCSDVMDNEITIDALELDIQEIFEQHDLEMSHKAFLEDLLEFSRGKEAWILSRENSTELLAKDSAMVTTEEFEALKTTLFDAYSRAAVTYKILLDEAEKLDKNKLAFRNKLKQVLTEIEIACVELQETTQLRVEQEQLMLDTMESMASIRLLSKKWEKRKGHKVLSLNLVKKALNREYIQEMDFAVNFRHKKKGRLLGSIILSSKVPFSRAMTSYYFIGQRKYKDVYDQINWIVASHIDVTFNIIRMKVNGQELKPYIDEEPTLNYEYVVKAPGTNKFCPYMDEDDPLMKKLEMMDQAFLMDEKRTCPHLFMFYEDIVKSIEK